MPSTHDAFISYSHESDGALAPVLERGLERLARPTFKLRAIDVFRDQTSLSASPGVWSGIVDHLAGSCWFVVLASPRFAASPWCQKELRWWLDTHGTGRLLIVLTDGAVVWDDAAGDFDWALTTALPREVAAGRFAEVPLYVDLRWVRDASGTPDVRDPRLRAAWLDLAAPIRGIPKDQLDGDDVRQLRLTRWLARGGVALITLAAAVAAWQAVEATRQRRQAEAERELAVSRQLAAQASALRVREPVLSLLLAAQSQAVAPTAEAQSALIELARSMPFERIAERDVALSSVIARASGLSEGALSTGGTLWAGDADGHVWRVPLPAATWTRIAEGRGGLLAGASVMTVSPDGRTVAAGGYSGNVKLVTEGTPVQSVSSDVEKEQMLLSLDFGPDRRLLAVAGQALDRPSGGGFVVLRDLASGERRVLPDYGNAARVRFSPDGRWLAIGGDQGEFALHPLRPGDKPPVLKLTRAGSAADIAFADGGKWLFVAWSFGRIEVLDMGSRVATVDSDGRLVVARDLHLVAPQRLQWQSTVDIQQAWLDAGQGRIGIVTPQGPRWIDPAARSVTVAPAEAVPSLLRGHGLDAVARQGALALKRKDKTIVLEGPGGTRTLPLDAPLATAAFSADGRLVYTLANRTVRAWATDTAEPAGPQAAVGELAGRLVASPDGRWLAIVHAAPLQIGKLARGVRQASVSLLSLPDLQLRVQRAELDIDANDFAGPEAMFSPDSHTLMFAGETRLSLFDIASMRRMDATVPLGDGVKVLGFLNGRWPLWLADTRTGRLLTLDVRREALADWACQLAGRSLTTAEWTRYLGNERPYAPRCKPPP